MLRTGIALDGGMIKINFEYLDESDYFKVFEYDEIAINTQQADYFKHFVNSVIRTVIEDYRFSLLQISFLPDTRNKRRCTQKQLQYLKNLLSWKFQYFLNQKQINFLSKQPICVISKLIDLFKIEIYTYSV